MSTGELNIPSSVKDPHYRYKMPRIQIVTQGTGNGVRTNWVNLPVVSNALKVPLEYPIKFIARELGSNTETKSNQYLINGNHEVDQMQELLDRFIRKYVLCPKCHLPEIHGKVRIGKKKEIKCTCRSCGTTSKLDSEHSFAAYIRSYPPPYERDAEVTEDQGKKIEKKEKKLDKELRKHIRECCLNLPGVIKDEEPMENNIEEIKKFINKYNFDLDCKFYCFSFGVFPEEIYTQRFLNRLPLMKHFIDNESDNKPEEAFYNFLIGFQDKIFSKQKGERQQYVSSVLYYLYDKDILKEEFWHNYLNGKIQEKYNSIFRIEDGEKKLKGAAEEFSNWIEKGKNEEEKSEIKEEEKNEAKEEKEEKEEKKEEKDEEDDEKGKKKGKKKKGKKKKEKEKEKEKPKEEAKEEKKEEPKEKPKEEKEEIKEEPKEKPKEEKEEKKEEEKKNEEEIDVDAI